MWNSNDFYERILDGWEKSETAKHVPYYVNHQSQRTQWDHPLLVKTWEELRDLNGIRYAAYRTAAKLRFLQKRLHLHDVTLSMVSGAFERHASQGREERMSCARVQRLLLDIYTLAKTSLSRQHNPEQMADLALNWLLNLYDVHRRGSINIHSARVALVILCTARLKEKYRYLFQHLSEGGSLNRKKLSSVLQDMMQLPESMGESASFGLNVAPAVDSCFRGSFNPTEVSEDVFLNWMLREPQTIVWLPTMHRMAAAESVQHDAKCSTCKAYPIVGLRYKCLKCFNYDICQHCFFSGKTSKKHKLKHPTEEYCFTTTSKEDTKAFIKIIRNNLSKKHCNKFKPRYLPIQGTDQPFQPEDGTHSGPQDSYGSLGQGNEENQMPAHVKSQPSKPQRNPLVLQNGNPGMPVRNKGIGPEERKQLESIVIHLEDENRELMDDIEQLTHLSRASSTASNQTEALHQAEEQARMAAKQEVLEAHNRQLEIQLERLKNLLKQTENQDELDAEEEQYYREALSPLSLNTPDLTPYHNSPPPYRINPDFIPSHHRHPLRSTPDTNDNTPYGSVNILDPLTPGLLSDLTYGSADGTLGRTHVSLSSADKGSHDFASEEAELAELMHKLDLAFPGDTTTQSVMTYSSQDNLKEVLDAAHKIGDAMSDFVGHIGKQDEQSMWDLAEELVVSRDNEADDEGISDETDEGEDEEGDGPALVYSMIDREEQTPWPNQEDDEAEPRRGEAYDSPWQLQERSPLKNMSSASPYHLEQSSHLIKDTSC